MKSNGTCCYLKKLGEKGSRISVVLFLGVYLYVRGVEKKKDMKKRSGEMTENEAIYV